MAERGHDEHVERPELGHEPSDASLGGVVGFAIALVVSAIVVHVVLWWVLQGMLAREEPVKPPASVLAATERDQLPPEPRLEGLASLGGPSRPLRAEEAAGDQYGWVDRKAGVVRIPVDEAVAILADKLPTRACEAGKAAEESEPARPSDSSSGRMREGSSRGEE